MLRAALLVLTTGLLALGLVLLLAGEPAGMPVALWSALLLVAVLVERWHYRPRTSGGSAWQDTPEQFIDPQSGAPMRVQFNPATGERRYVPAAGPARDAGA